MTTLTKTPDPNEDHKFTFPEVQQALYRVMVIACDLHCEISHEGQPVSIAGCKICEELTDHCKYLAGLENPTIRASELAAREFADMIVGLTKRNPDAN